MHNTSDSTKWSLTSLCYQNKKNHICFNIATHDITHFTLWTGETINCASHKYGQLVYNAIEVSLLFILAIEG